MQLVEVASKPEEADNADQDSGERFALAILPAASKIRSSSADQQPALMSCKTAGGGKAGGSIPFKWETEPGIPIKIRVKEDQLLSPLQPPPSHHPCNSGLRSSPRAIPRAGEKPISPRTSPFARPASFSAHTSPRTFSKKFKSIISPRHRCSLDATQAQQRHAARFSFLEQVSHLHSHSQSTYMSTDDHIDHSEVDEPAFYTPMHSSATPASFPDPKQKASHCWGSSLSIARECDGSELGVFMLDDAPASLHDIRANCDGDGSFSHNSTSFQSQNPHEQPQVGDQSWEPSPESSPTSHLSLKLPSDHHPSAHNQNASPKAAKYKRKLLQAATTNCHSAASNASHGSSIDLPSLCGFEFSGRIGSARLVPEHHGTDPCEKPHIPVHMEIEDREPLMDLSMFTLCRASSMNSTTPTRRSLYDYDKSRSMQLLKSVDSSNTSYGLGSMDMDKEISKQFLWLTSKKVDTARGQKQPLLARGQKQPLLERSQKQPQRQPQLAKSRATRMPFRSFLEKLVPCMATAGQPH